MDKGSPPLDIRNAQFTRTDFCAHTHGGEPPQNSRQRAGLAAEYKYIHIHTHFCVHTYTHTLLCTHTWRGTMVPLRGEQKNGTGEKFQHRKREMSAVGPTHTYCNPYIHTHSLLLTFLIFVFFLCWNYVCVQNEQCQQPTHT